MGYGAKALQALSSYYSGEIMSVDESTLDEKFETFEEAASVRKVRDILVNLYHQLAQNELSGRMRRSLRIR